MPASAILGRMISETVLQFGLTLLGAVTAGAGIGWLVRGSIGGGRMERLNDDWQLKYDETIRQKQRLTAEATSLRSSIETQQAVIQKHEQTAKRTRTEIESASEKIKALQKDTFTLRGERDELKQRISRDQAELNAAKQQIEALEAEFIKSGDFYKGELQKAFEKRKTIETKLDAARSEQESLTNLLDAARAEHASVNKMLASAQSRLDNLDEMEQNVIRLEAENAELRHAASATKQKIAALQRDVAELETLKVQNRELAHCLQSMENSRRQYETDAKRYREQADKSEQLSETLRLRLDDVERNFTEMAKKHDEALEVARKQPETQAINGHEREEMEVDDLTQIVGIGKAFQQTLNDLGVYSFRQLANFGPADIARVNMELKEFKGRMEQDDWIGQAKDLYYKKYSEQVEL